MSYPIFHLEYEEKEENERYERHKEYEKEYNQEKETNITTSDKRS